MKLEGGGLPDFEPLVARVTTLAFTSGIQALEKVGASMHDITTSVALRRRFTRGCHYGYDLAQREVGKAVIDLENEIRSSEEELKSQRRDRHPAAEATLQRIKVLRNRQLVLRRVIDAILHIVLWYRTWVMKRMIVDSEIRRIDPVSLRRNLDVAAERNREERSRFAIVVDLTTFVHLGDLIEIDLAGPGGVAYRVIELKEGKINNLLSGVLEEKSYHLSPADWASIRQKMGDYAPKQAARILRQHRRLNEFQRIIETDRGIDPQYSVEMRLFPDAVQTDNYSDAILGAIERAQSTGVGSAVVDDCLRLIALGAERAPADDLGIVAHLARPGEPCRLGDPHAREIELAELGQVPPFVDLVDHNIMRGAWGHPVFVWSMPPEKLLDLVMGRTRIFAQFDLNAFFQLGERQGIRMTWLVGREAEGFRRFSSLIPGSPRAWGIRAELPDGSIQNLLSGFVARAIIDLTTPKQLIQLITRYPEQRAKLKSI